MIKKFFFLFVIGLISVQAISLGSCAKYSKDGQSCQECITNYHLFDGQCYVDILGCSQYKFGNICHQCQRNYILVNNLCCDMVCMNKLFSRFKKAVKQELISNNSQILNKLIPYALENYIKNSNARLVSVQLKEFQEVKRFFFLYEFYSVISDTYERRLILDYSFKSGQIIPVDWSDVKDSWSYSVVQWTEVEDDVAVLAYYPTFYPSNIKYDEVVARKASVNLIDEYQIATKTPFQSTMRIHEIFNARQYLLVEELKNIAQPTPIVAPIDPLPKAPVTIEEVKAFTPYSVTYKGSEIPSNYITNEPMRICINTVRVDPKFNHQLTLIQESANTKGVITFEIVGENRLNGGLKIIRYVVQYNTQTRSCNIISISEESVGQTSSIVTPDNSGNIIIPTTKPVDPVPTIPEFKIFIVEQGPTTNYHYYSPVSEQTNILAKKLKQIYEDQVSKNGVDKSGVPKNLVFRRIVITDIVPEDNWREIAYVEYDTVSPLVQYFTYFIESKSPVLSYYFVGTNSQKQSQQVYNNPHAYPLYISDPSFKTYPNAKYYNQTGVSSSYLKNLEPTQQNIFSQLQIIERSEVDRFMGRVIRFRIDFFAPEKSKKYRGIGYHFVELTGQNIPQFSSYLSPIKSTVDEAVSQKILSPLNGDKNLVLKKITEISTNALGQESVKSNNVDELLNDDKILNEVMSMVAQKKPVVSDYVLVEVAIAEYSLSIEYSLIYMLRNKDNKADFVPSSEILVVVVHDKTTHQNQLISFEIKPINSAKTPVNQFTQGNEPSFLPVNPVSPKDDNKLKNIVEDIISQLEGDYKMIVPSEVDVSEKVDPVTGVAKIILSFKDKNNKPVYVTASGNTKTTDPSVILEINTSAPENIQKPIVSPIVEPVSPPKQISSQPLSVSQPSQQVVNSVQEKPEEQINTIEGELRKILINPKIENLDSEVSLLVDDVLGKDSDLRKKIDPTYGQPLKVKIVAIELAAITINVQYAFTIRITYKTIVQFRRYFYIKDVSRNKMYFMGYEDIPSTFDVKNAQTRAFNDYDVLEKTTLSEKPELSDVICKGLTSELSTPIKTQNIDNMKKRKFPSGQYVKVTVTTDKFIGLGHIIVQDSQTNTKLVFLINWNIIKEINTPIVPVIQNPESPVSQQVIPVEKPVAPTPQVIKEIIEVALKKDEKEKKVEPTAPIAKISLSMQQKLDEILAWVSAKHPEDLKDANLEQSSTLENYNINKELDSVKFNLYFVKNVNEFLVIEYYITIFRNEDGTISEQSFDVNEITLKKEVPVQTKPILIVDPVQPSPTTPEKPKTIIEQIVQKQEQTNTDLVIVDPNENFYNEAIGFINKDDSNNPSDVLVDVKSGNVPQSLLDIIKYIRATYIVVNNAKILTIIQVQKSSTVERYRIYFFKEASRVNNILNYQIYKIIIEYNRITPLTKYNVISFELYANNNQLVSTKDSLEGETDIAYGYSFMDLAIVPSDSNVQNVLKQINRKYKDLVSGFQPSKVEYLELKDGRINYKIILSDSTKTSEYKFIIFYQPTLKKVLVLNSINAPTPNNYNQLSKTDQEADSVLSSVLNYINSIHPETAKFTVRSVSKATITSGSEYNIVFELKNRKFRSIMRVASDNIEFTEIKYAELAEISLDHYRLDLYDELFIMNYQKLTQDEIKSDSKFRMALNYLYGNKQIKSASLIGAATKSFGLGFLYKIFIVDSNSQLFVAEIYIESYSNKITLKSYKNFSFDGEFASISLQTSAVTKLISNLKNKPEFTSLVAKSAEIQDFLFGSLYRLTFVSGSDSFNVYVYHDHSSEQIYHLFNRAVDAEVDQCEYSSTTCVSCKNNNFRVSDNKCVQIISNCVNYLGNKCTTCKQGSKLFNNMCILETECGPLCQVITI